MKIKLDENTPAALADSLRALGHDVATVPDEGLAGYADPDIWAAAQQENRFLITQDLDFSNIQQFAPGTHHGILLVRLRVPVAWHWRKRWRACLPQSRSRRGAAALLC